jgi:DNA polymerase-1
MTESLYIIDGHAHIYAAYFAPMSQRLVSPAGEPTKAVYIFTTAIVGLIESRKPDMLVVAMDSKAPPFRVEIYPEYKAHRPPMPDDMPAQIDRIEQILGAMDIPVLRIDGFEADDIIGTLSKKAAKKGIDVYICSKDKDMLQLLDKYIFTFDIKTGKVTTVESMKNEMLLSPQQFVDVLALQGDTSDNVPGIADVGPKTALGWIQQYGSIENLYKHADEITGKRGDNLRNSRDLVKLSKQLVTIDCSAPVDIDYKAFAVKEYRNQKVAEIFTELGFNRLLKQFGLSAVAAKTKAAPKAKTVGKSTGPDSVKTIKHDYQLLDTPAKFDKFSTQLKKQKLFAVDTETTSLDPMRGELVGLSFCFKPHQAFYIPVRAPIGQKHLVLSDVRKKLASILADEKVKKIGQNIKFDMLIMRNSGIPLDGVYFDTMVASYCLDPERTSHGMDKMAADFLNYQCIPISALIGKGKNQLTFDMVDTAAAAEYAAEDADITFQLYEYLLRRLDNEPQLKKLFEEVEMPLVSVLAQMEYNGVAIDVKLLKRMSGELAERLKSLCDEIYGLTGSVFNIDSPKQLAEVLFDKLGLESIKVGKAGRSTDVGVLEQLAGEHPAIKLILEYRQLGKLKNTYTDKLGTIINPKTSKVHTSFNQTVTATGRLSSSDPNLQNIPIRTDIGRKIRSAFTADSAKNCILSADYSQIELRLLAHFSKDKALISAFEKDQDIHRFVASQIYNVPLNKVTDKMRSDCKAVNFGIIYGQGPFGLSQSIGISQAEAKKFIDDYFKRYGSIRKFMDSVIADAKKNGFAETIFKRRRKIPDLKSKNFNKRSRAERLAVNTVIQGSAADLIKVAMINIHNKIQAENLPVKMILQIHDELVFELPASQAQKHSKWIEKEMSSAIKLDVPLKVDINYGRTWLADK